MTGVNVKFVDVTGNVSLLVERAGRGVDVRAVLCATAGAGDAGPRPVRRRRLAARRHAATRAATEASAHRPSRGETLSHLTHILYPPVVLPDVAYRWGPTDATHAFHLL